MSHRDAMRDNDAKRLCVVCDTWRSVYDTLIVPRPDGTDARVCIACAVTLLRGTHDAGAWRTRGVGICEVRRQHQVLRGYRDMTKQTLRQRVAAQSERIRELEGRLRALELRLSEHCGDNTRHSQPEIVRGPERARPMLDPDDGAPPGTGTITTSGQCTEWYTEPIAGSADNCAVQPVDADRIEVVLDAGLALL